MSSAFFAENLRIFCAEAADRAAGRRFCARRKKLLLKRFGRRLAYDAQAGAWGDVAS
jgi:hypothetical protein